MITSWKGNKKLDSLASILGKDIFKTKNITKKTLKINSVSGLELEASDDKGYRRAYFLLDNHKFYIAVGYGQQNNIKSRTDIAKFLKSFEILPTEKNATKFIT